MRRPTVCLTMIVRDEAQVVTRAILSALPLIDTWLIVDTGSTDGTQDVVRGAMGSVPGELVERPWVDFATNRSEALSLARQRADYALMLDADDALELSAGFEMPHLVLDAYDIEIRLGGVRYFRPQLFASRLPWRYRGVVHEFAEAEGAGPRANLPGAAIVCGSDGARRKNPATYLRDRALLERALSTETDPFLVSRYTFYLAQSCRDSGEVARAVELYLLRGSQEYWVEERYVAYLNAGRLIAATGGDPERALAALEAASMLVPTRAEALYEAAVICRLLQQYDRAVETALRGRDLTEPDGLFVEGVVYRFALLDELAVSAYHAERWVESISACLAILREGRAPADHRDRVVANAASALEGLLNSLRAD